MQAEIGGLCMADGGVFRDVFVAVWYLYGIIPSRELSIPRKN